MNPYFIAVIGLAAIAAIFAAKKGSSSTPIGDASGGGASLPDYGGGGGVAGGGRPAPGQGMSSADNLGFGLDSGGDGSTGDPVADTYSPEPIYQAPSGDLFYQYGSGAAAGGSSPLYAFSSGSGVAESPTAGAQFSTFAPAQYGYESLGFAPSAPVTFAPTPTINANPAPIQQIAAAGSPLAV